MPTNNSINTGKPIEVTKGGTQKTSFTAYAPVIGGTIATNPLQSADSGISTVGYVLTSNGSSSAPTWQSSSAGGSTGLILLNTQTVTNVSSVDFLSILTPSYNNLLIVVNNYLPDTNDTNLVIQLSGNNGASWRTTFGYDTECVAVNFNSTTWGGFRRQPNGLNNGFTVMARVNSAGVPGSGSINIFNVTQGVVNQTKTLSAATSLCDNFVSSGYGLQYADTFCSSTINFAPINALRAVSTSGNIAQGTFSLYAYIQ